MVPSTSQTEKKSLLEKVSALESSVKQLKADAEKQKTVSDEFKATTAKLAEAEKSKETLTAKSKDQDKKIQELTAKVSTLEKAKKVN